MSVHSGQTLGKYQIIERLGRGGMADVYKGYQPGLDRYVAIKVLHPHLSEDSGFITRFKREARSVAELRHPHIVQVFDFDVQGENYYMVMEYIEGGKTLKQLLQELAARGERLPIDKTIDLVAKLADALDYAHGLGMVHRDIKPANVLVPSFTRPVLSDFGIARLLGETGLTTSGQMVGTPAYMSPEQGRGERGDIRSDIYALGIVLYEMLTGRTPYDADTPYAVILKHINDPLTPPRQFVSSVPEAVERIVLKCLAKNPDDRYASMAELREALRAARSEPAAGPTLDLAAPPTQKHTSPPVTPIDEATIKPTARLPKWAPLAALAALVIVFVVLVSALRGQAPAGTTVQRTDQPSGPSGVQSLIDSGYQSLYTGNVDDALGQFRQALSLEPGNPNALVGWAIAELARYGDAETAGQYLDQAAQSIPDDPYLHYGYGQLYIRSESRHDPQAAEAEVSRALETCGDDVMLCMEAYRLRSNVRFWYLEDPAGGLADIDSALALSTDPHGTAYLHAERADYRLSAGDPAGAIEDFVAAYELDLDSDFLQRAAQIAVGVEDYPQALSFYDRLLERFPGDPYYIVRRGYVEWHSGDPETALESAERALRLDPDLLEAHYLLGLVLLDQDDPEPALAEFDMFAAITDPDQRYQASYPFFITELGHDIAYEKARALHALGDLDGALAQIDEALSRDDYWPQPYIERGHIFAEQDKLDLARESYLQARDIAADDPDLQSQIDELLAELGQ